MKQFSLFLLVSLLSVFFVAGLPAQDRFDRVATIPADTVDIGGFGNIVVGVDLDGDEMMEIYAVNSDWYDIQTKDLVPRIYKYEMDANGMWHTVWSTRLPLNFQNTWPALAVGDLDGDGKGEVIWGPVNNFGSGLQPNPERIVVFETPGDGSDVMGVKNADGTYRPNAQWTITETASQNIRPFRWLINDIDGDEVDEIVAGCRAGDGIQVYSVDDIPDAADSTETWTKEFGGVAETFYDIAILDGSIYGIDDDGDVYKVTFDATGDSFIVSAPQIDIAGTGSWNSATTVDVDGDEQDEIIVASWGTSSGGDNDIYLLQVDGDSLISTKIKDVPSGSFRSYGGAAGDIDGDGNLDFVFGTRQSTPNAIIHRLEYQGGAIDDPNNWELTIIDSEVSDGQQYDYVGMADLDGDGEDEVVYTGTPRGLGSTDPPQPIVVLNRIEGNQPVIAAVDDVPNDQGRQVWVVWQASQDDVLPVNGIAQKVQIAVMAEKGVEFPLRAINGVEVEPVYIDQSIEVNGLQAVGDIMEYGVWRVDGDGLPVQVNTTKAVQFPMYAAVVPTLGDGAEWETAFVVSAHGAEALMNWKSYPKTGVSVDNLVPTAPTSLTATAEANQISLSWDESPDEDFNYFSIRRGESAGFNAASPASEIGTTTDPSYIDATIENDKTYYYRVVAFDFNANQGDLSDEVNATVTNIGENGLALPETYALYQNYPNPFNPSTTIKFDLPEQANVSIVVYNILGSKVRTLYNGARVAGSHQIVWDGMNDQGIRVTSGVYIYTIKAGTFVESKKMTLMK